jgi:hypothetical protein
MKTAFVDKRLRTKSLILVEAVNGILSTYQGQGLRLTLRQLFYQLVVRNFIQNTERSYKALGSVVSDARLAGLIDWAAIEDRIRTPRRPSEFASLEDLVDAALAAYRLPRLQTQESYVELWVEKDALSGVLAPLSSEYHVTLMVNRGYSSQSAMYDAYQRFRRQEMRGKQCRLLYLGDHDPSGEDMVRDIDSRLRMFGVPVEVVKIALTMDQVQQYTPPPNPAKMTDSRFAQYSAKFGDESWEVDALPPDVLVALIREALDGIVDSDAMDEVKDQEEGDKQLLLRAVVNLRGNGQSS